MDFQDIDLVQLSKASDTLRAVTHPLRLSIITLLDDKSELNVHQIYSTLKLEQSITSQHLKILRDTKVVNTNRIGKMIFYTLNYDTLNAISKAVINFDLITRERKKKNQRISVMAE